MTNHVNYLVQNRPSQNVEDLPSEKRSVDLWLEGIDDESSLQSGPRQFWDDADTKAIQKAFKNFKKCPTKAEMRDMFLKKESLAPICKKEGFSRCYEKVKTVMKRLLKK